MSERWYLLALSACFFAGCASYSPVVPIPPEVRVTQLDSLLITPESIKFQAKVVIDNRMGAGLDIEKVVYGADVQDHPVFTETFDQLHPMKKHGRQTVTFPFQIAMKDIAKHGVDVLADEALRINFRGDVHPVGFDPVPFQSTRTIPIPRMPVISLEGAEGSPLEGVFKLSLRMANPNPFALGLKSIDSYVEINGKRYGLLRTQGCAEIKPGASERIVLTMQQSAGKTISMLLNLAQSEAPQFAVGGSITCQTPYGLVFVPLHVNQ